MTESQDAVSAVRIVVRPYASSLPLGAFAFGIGNTLLAAFAMHWIPMSEKNTLAVILLAFVAPLELIPCVLAFLARDSGGATAMGIFAAGWTVQGIQLILTANASQPSVCTGVFLFLLALCLAVLAFVTISGKPVVGVLLVVAILRSIGAALGQFGIHGSLDIVTAVLDAVVGLLAFYCGFAYLVEDAKGKLIPWTVRRDDAKVALDGTFGDQMKHIEHEAGVRIQQ